MKAILYLSSASEAVTIMARLNNIGATQIQQLSHMDRFIIADILGTTWNQIRTWPEVLEIEYDANAFQAQGTQILSSEDNWGLDRIDQERLPLSGVFRYARTADNVDVYVVDSGVNLMHEEFISNTVKSRVSRLYDYRVDLDLDSPQRILPNSASYALDDNGHGTLMASVIGGQRYGVAKYVGIKSVKVFSESLNAYTSWIIRGLDAVLGDHLAKGSPADAGFRPSLANMSFSASMRDSIPILAIAVQVLMNYGVICVCAAGNDGNEIGKFLDAGSTLKPKVTPGSLSDIIAVGATDRTDAVLGSIAMVDGTTTAGFKGSNFGFGVDMYAPGEEIRGAWRAQVGNPYTPTGVVSGTSPATALVTGVVALYLEDYANLYADDPTNVTQVKVKQFLQATSSRDRLLRNVFVPGNLQWVTPAGLLQTFYEDQPLRIQLKASNGGNADLVYSFALDSDRTKASLAGVALTSDGLLFGTAKPVDTTSEEYVFVDSLPEEQRNVFPTEVKGYLDLTLEVLTQDKTSTLSRYNYTAQSRSFVLRILDRNKGPKWTPPEKVVRLDLLPAFSENYFTVQNQVYIDLKDGFIGHSIGDPDNDVLDWNTVDGAPQLLVGSMPPGLTLNSNGTITGTLEPFPSVDGGKTRLYQFIIRAYDGRLYADKFFQVLVRRISEGNHAPEWNDANSKSYTRGELAKLTRGQAVLIRLEAFDQEGDSIEFYNQSPIDEPDSVTQFTQSLASGPLASFSWSVPGPALAPTVNDPEDPNFISWESPRFHGLPLGVYMDSDGTLRGVVDPDNRLGEYYFQINVTDGFDNGVNFRVFRIDILDDSSVGWFEPISNVDWLTPEGLLGELNETYSSHLQVAATSQLNLPIIYEMSNSVLPQGLTLNQTTGEIQGNAPYVSADTEYEFKIKAYLQKYENMFSVQRFVIRVKQQFTQPISVVRAAMIGPEQSQILDFIRSSKVFESQNTNLIYKPLDPSYGIRKDLTMYVLGGLPVMSPADFYAKIRDDLPVTDPSAFTLANVTPVSNYHRTTSFVLGDIKLAKARDSFGNVLYEMLYVEIYDPGKRAGGFASDSTVKPIPYAHPKLDDPTSPELIFPTAITNWRNDLQQTPSSLVGEERLPLWMSSQQVLGDENSVLGFVPSIELMCLNSGYSAQSLMATLNVTGFNSLIRNRKFTVDRYLWEDWTNPNNVRRRFFKFPPGDLH